MTAHAMKGDRERCIGMGMSDYIPKPIMPGVLAEMLDKWLVRAPEDAAPRTVPTSSGEAEPVSGPVVFDRQTLLDRLLGDRELVKEICAGYLEEMPEQLQRLRQAVDRNDGDLVGKMSHTMKGAAANVGAMALSAAALNMEKTARGGRPEQMALLLPEMERHFDVLKKRMGEDLI